jgi:uracil-DNA glycosylase
MKKLLSQIKACSLCEKELPFGAHPVVVADSKSKIIIIGQAPGRIVHQTGIPWNDKSGDQLRKWMGVEKEVFYHPQIFALMPMGFCYPGKGKSGDLPPRPECAPQWHAALLSKMKEVKLILLIGQYAQQFYLGKNAKENLTATVKAFQSYLPVYFPLPHPSPRNIGWHLKNPWFINDVIPQLKNEIAFIIN